MNIFSRRAESAEQSPGGEGPLDDLFEWMDSPEGVLFERTRELVWEDLEEVAVDEAGQRLVWEDKAAFSIEQSAQRILDSVEPGQGFTLEGIEQEIVGWLEQGYVPEGLDESESEQMERRIERWIEAYRKTNPRSRR